MCKKKAFTLIELLVVISIIALLMAIMMPALSKTRSMARRVICGSHMHNMGLAIENYKADQDGYYPIAFWGTTSFNRTIYTESLIKAGLIEGEETSAGNNEWVVSAGSTREAYSCPSFRRFLKVRSDVLYGWDNTNIAEYYPIGYGYNSHLSRYDIWDDSKNEPASSPDNPYIGKTPNSSTLMLIDSSAFFLNNLPGSKFYPVYEISSRFASSNGSIAGSHTGGVANSLWVDMHVEQRKADEYSQRSDSDPADLTGSSVLDHRAHQYDDRGYAKSSPKGKIACPE
ncbi:MAG: type II secretion system protein [Sedimentisphaeraceae bacterium JB056]